MTVNLTGNEVSFNKEWTPRTTITKNFKEQEDRFESSTSFSNEAQQTNKQTNLRGVLRY